MMKGIVKTVCLAWLVFSSSVYSATIYYEAADLTDIVVGQDLWNYRYEVHDLSTDANGFDIFFPVSFGFQFGDLENNPAIPSSDWDVIAIQPDPLLPADGLLDAISLASVPALPEVFNIDFIWRGSGTPGSQPFEVFNDNFDIIASGRTVPLGITHIPEPGIIWLMLAGLLMWGAEISHRNSKHVCRC
ncbi:MAG: hypothetical protein ACU836_17160 [Gammaproteobacteria bacterium]